MASRTSKKAWSTLAGLLSLILAGCGPPTLSQFALTQLQDKHGGDTVTVVKWHGQTTDDQLDLTASDDSQIEELRRIKPFRVIQVEYRVANRQGQQELHRDLIAIGKDRYVMLDVRDVKSPDPIAKIVEMTR